MFLGYGIDTIRKQAEAFTRSMFERHDLSREQTTDDLRDTAPRFLKTREGRRVSANLTREDLGWGSPSTALVFLHASWPAVVAIFTALASIDSPFAVGVRPLIAMMFLATALLMLTLGVIDVRPGTQIGDKTIRDAGFLGWLQRILVLAIFLGGVQIPALWLVFSLFSLKNRFSYVIKEHDRRMANLRGQGAMAAGEAAPIAERMGEAHIEAREAQRKAALTDKSPFFQIGTATGTLTAVGDGYAPDRGLPLGMTANDLSTSLMVFGETGSGKTSGLLRPLMKWWIDNKIGGALVLDGKGGLPSEFVGMPGYILIAPGHSSYSLIAGLNAEDVADVLSRTMKGEDKDDIWSRSAQTLLRNAAVLLEACNETNPMDFPWTLLSLRDMVCDPEAQRRAIAEIESSGKHKVTDAATTIISTAFRYFKHELPAIAEETRSGYVSNAESWLSPIIGHRDLYEWAKAADGIDPTSVCQGAIIGIATPEFKYGAAGLAVQQLVKARIYRAIKQRGSDWAKVGGQKPVLMLIDECQELVSKEEAAMSAISRSLGLRYACATQHIDGLYAKFGGDVQAKAMLGNFRSLVSFMSTPDTLRYVSERMGPILRREVQANTGSIAWDQITKTQAEVAPETTRAYDTVATSVMRVVRKKGSTQEAANAEMIKAAGMTENMLPQYQLNVAPALSPAEASVFLRTPFTAAVQVMRGGVIRRDVVKVTPDFG